MSYTANFVNDFRIKIKHKIYRRCHGNNLQTFVTQSAGLYGLSFKCFRRSVAKLTLLLYADTNFNESCLLLHNIAHRERKPQRGPCHGSGGYSPASHHGGPGSIPGQSMWNLWLSKWHWDRFFPPEYFGFPLSISHSTGAPLHGRTKNFITWLHNKP